MIHPDVLARAANIKLLCFDVDGVLTDGGLYYDDAGKVSKRFDARDGLGIKLAQRAGIHVAIVTGLSSGAVAARAAELGIAEYHAGFFHKAPIVEAMLERLGLEPCQAAFMGDDWVDAGPMRLVGLPIAPADAQPEILALARHVTPAPGGRGAAREAIRLLLHAQGVLDVIFADWAKGER